VLVWASSAGRRASTTSSRDHCPTLVSPYLRAAAYGTGQVVGETDSRAERPKNGHSALRTYSGGVSRARHRPEADAAGLQRPPMRLLDDGEAIAELI